MIHQHPQHSTNTNKYSFKQHQGDHDLLLLALPVMAPAGGKGHVLHASRVGVAPTSEKDPAAGDTPAAAAKADPQPEADPHRDDPTRHLIP